MYKMKKMKLAGSILVYSMALISFEKAIGQSTVSLKIGDKAPPVKYSKWIKGEPLVSLDPSRLYVLEFWATWCGPCKMAMPHLTKLQQAYKGKAIFIGVGVWEKVSEDKAYESSLPYVEKFVKGNDANMGYAVIADNNEQFMGNNWLKAAGENGIPSTFIVKNNQVIWIGHPNALDSTLPKILDGSYDMKAFAAKHSRSAEAGMKQAAAMQAMFKPIHDAVKAKEYKKAYSLIDELVAKQPQYKMMMELMKFRVMLGDNEQEAVEYAKGIHREGQSIAPLLLGEVYAKEGLSKSTYLWVAKNCEEAKLSPNPVLSNALAATYAKAGDYTMAVVHQEKAVLEARAALNKGEMIGTIMDFTVQEYEKSLTDYKKKAESHPAN
jgi:thiol-disulfide isomerase/thioredoxin